MSATDKELGKLFVFAGASGSGKTTICQRLAAKGLGEISISHTTRDKSDQEKDGIEYYFVDRECFVQMIEADKMAEWAEVHGELYGTGVQWLEEKQATGSNIILDIDTQGMLQLRAKMKNIHTTFILPESWEVLKQRLCSRKRDSEEQIKRRLETALQEFKQIGEFDYVLVNKELDRSYSLASSIIKSYCDDQESVEVAASCRADNQVELIEKWRKFIPDGI